MIGEGGVHQLSTLGVRQPSLPALDGRTVRRTNIHFHARRSPRESGKVPLPAPHPGAAQWSGPDELSFRLQGRGWHCQSSPTLGLLSMLMSPHRFEPARGLGRPAFWSSCSWAYWQRSRYGRHWALRAATAPSPTRLGLPTATSARFFSDHCFACHGFGRQNAQRRPPAGSQGKCPVMAENRASPPSCPENREASEPLPGC